MPGTNDFIDQLFRTTAEVIYDTDMQHGDGRSYWPFHPVLLDSLVAPTLFKEMLRLFKALQAKGYTLKDIGDILRSPTKIANYQYLWPIKTTKRLSVQERYELAKYFVKLLITLRNGEPFCENGRNLVWSRSQLLQELKDHGPWFMDAEKDTKAAQLLARLEGLLVTYAESLYYYMIDLSRMMHGPYTTDNRTVFVKEFFHLKAGDLWDVVENFPFDHIKTIGLYRDIRINVFFMGHTHSVPAFPKAIQKFSITLDEKPITNLAELERAYDRAQKVVERAARTLALEAKNRSYLLRKGIDMFFYPLKPLYEEVGEEWRDILPAAHSFAESVEDSIVIPGPWGNWSKQKAAKHLVKLMNFKRNLR
jgi:DNA-binding transcriptional MerR regulator